MTFLKTKQPQSFRKRLRIERTNFYHVPNDLVDLNK